MNFISIKPIYLQANAILIKALILGLALGTALSACSLAEAVSVTEEATPVDAALNDIIDESGPFDNGQIAYIGTDGNLYLINLDGSSQTAITTDAVLPTQNVSEALYYQHPTWARDGRHLAYVHSQRSLTSGSKDIVFIYNLENGESTEVYSSAQEFVIYPYWSPDNQVLSLLTNAAVGSNLLLQMVTLRGDVQVVDQGQPYYWSFAPFGKRVFVHSGRDESGNPASILKILDLDGANSETIPIELNGATFQAPTWSQTGDKILTAIRLEDGHSEIVALDAEANIIETITRVNGSAAFGLSADGSKVALIEKSSPASPLFQGKLRVFDLDSGEEIFATKESNAFAFFWSPDSLKLAIYTYQLIPANDFEASLAGNRLISRTMKQSDQLDDIIKISVEVYDLSSGKTNTLMRRMTPGDGLMRVLFFFDQYQQSDTFWSPDSRWILVMGTPRGGEAGVWVLDATREESARFLAEGVLAFWSWR